MHLRRIPMVASLILVMGLGGLTAIPVCGAPGDELFKLVPADGVSLDFFGSAVAVDSTTAVIGAHQDQTLYTYDGSAYIYDTITGTQVHKITPSDPGGSDVFGYSVAVSGTKAVIGAPQNDDLGADSGAAYIFDTVTGNQLFKLLPTDGAPGDRFGWDVAIDGDIVVIGADQDDDYGPGSGSAYIFDADTGLQTHKLLPSDGQYSDYFGVSVDVSGDTVIVGAWYDDDNGSASGSAYLFDAATGLQTHKLLPLDGSSAALFGREVAVDGTTAIVGAHGANPGGTGAAYVFDTVTGIQLYELEPDVVANFSFGWDVQMYGTTAVVSHHNDSEHGNYAGAAFLFDTTTGAQIAKFSPADVAEDDKFGESVAIFGSTVLANGYLDDDNGYNSGSAYVFEGVTATTPTLAASLTCLPGSGTVPFTTQMTVMLDNLYAGQTRRFAARIDITLAGGTSYSNWRSGYTNVAAGGSFNASWSQSIPAVASVIGANNFTLDAEDVTPAPFNQPPHPAAGNTATSGCTVTGVAP